MASVMNSSRRRLSLDIKLWLQCQIPTEEDCLGCRTVATMCLGCRTVATMCLGCRTVAAVCLECRTVATVCLGSRTVATVLNSSRKRLSLDINLELQC